MSQSGIPLKPQKPIWWRLIAGSLLLYVEINNHLNPAPNLLKASNSDQQLGMNAMAVILVITAIWLIVTGTRPVWRRNSN
jgi:hypothetical protein